jgi:hypothetical protein
MSHRPSYAAPGGSQDGLPHAEQSGGQVARPPLPPCVVSSTPVLLSCRLPPTRLVLSTLPLLPCCPSPNHLPCIIHRPLLSCCPPPAIPCTHPHTLLPQSTIQSCCCKHDNIATVIVPSTSALQPTNPPSATAHCWVCSIPAIVLPPLLAAASLLSITAIIYCSHYTYTPTVATAVVLI